MFEHHFERFFFYLREGGFVMATLAISMIILWAALGYRMAILKRGGQLVLEEAKFIVAKYSNFPAVILKDTLEYDFHSTFNERLARFAIMVRSMVVAAPLLGLLGTVSGMMETFESLNDPNFHAQSGGIAGGIAEALIATQLGLAVAIPGLLIGRVLQRKEEIVRAKLNTLIERTCREHSAEYCEIT